MMNEGNYVLRSLRFVVIIFIIATFGISWADGSLEGLSWNNLQPLTPVCGGLLIAFIFMFLMLAGPSLLDGLRSNDDEI